MYAGIDWRDKRVLEIGPGPDLGTGAIVLARGAASYQAVDAFDNVNRSADSFYRALETRLERRLDKSRLAFRQVTFPTLPEIDDTYDLIVSNATLEHVENVPAFFSRLRELTAPGCKMAHHIDAQTHTRIIRDRDPLNILRYGETVYRRLLWFPGAPNRLLADDYERAATNAGFEITGVLPRRVAHPDYLAKVQPALATSFRDRDCSILSFTLVATAAADGRAGH
jgi:cyclopropane fatty-acyl-phospholipid synthase-like methyltransferase